MPGQLFDCGKGSGTALMLEILRLAGVGVCAAFFGQTDIYGTWTNNAGSCLAKKSIRTVLIKNAKNFRADSGAKVLATLAESLAGQGISGH